MSEARGFVVYDDIAEILDALTDEQVGRLFRGMVNYHSTGSAPNFTDELRLAFIPIKQIIDRGEYKYAKRCEKNRENIRKRWDKTNENDTNVYDRIRTNTNDTNTKNKIQNTEYKEQNTKDKIQKSTGVDVWSLSFSILSYLNQKAGTSHKTDDAESVHLISDLVHAGFTETDLKHVIDVKVSDWLGNPAVERYLRPSTLFGAKFEQYLAQPKPPEVIRAEKKQERTEANRERAEALQNELDIVKDNMTKADTPTRIRLREREAWLEDEIKRLTS